jgi:acetyl-CoA acetyltransferase
MSSRPWNRPRPPTWPRELTWQLRGRNEKRRVQDVKVALQHNIGLGGAAVVSIYRKSA